jgi:hypothetical protein
MALGCGTVAKNLVMNNPKVEKILTRPSRTAPSSTWATEVCHNSRPPNDTPARTDEFLNEMKTFRAKILAAVLVSAGVVPLAYPQTAPRDVLPPTSVARPPVSPTLNVPTPGNVAVPSPVPTAITPQAPAPPAQSVPQSPTPGVVETNKLQAPATGEAVGSGPQQSSLWTQTNAAPPSAWGKTTTAVAATPSAAKPTPDPWFTPPSNTNLWDSTVPPRSSGTKTDWK